MNKKVSVIIPNYNYARFLQRRIDCIVNQTIKPAEIIFLDDCSTDNSLEVAQEILSKTDVPYRIIPNEVNQGVFKQWLKGIELTQNDYFWIAEADDYCELNFLETLLPAFDDKDVVISYCQSNFINTDGKIIANESDYKSQMFDSKKWESSYVNLGMHEIENFLVVINTIPNVSAVVLNKKKISLTKIQLVNRYNKAGDWMFYLLVLSSFKDNRISYNSNKLNYYVRHENSAYISNYQKPELFGELLDLYDYVLEIFDISPHQSELIFKKLYELSMWYQHTLENEHLLNMVLMKLGDYSILKEVINAFHKLKFELAESEFRLLEVKSKLLEMESKLTVANNLISSKKIEVDNLLNSKSWKITTPLRFICKIIKKM